MVLIVDACIVLYLRPSGEFIRNIFFCYSLLNTPANPMNAVRKRKYRFCKNKWRLEEYLGNMLAEQCFNELSISFT